MPTIQSDTVVTCVNLCVKGRWVGKLLGGWASSSQSRSRLRCRRRTVVVVVGEARAAGALSTGAVAVAAFVVVVVAELKPLGLVPLVPSP